MTHYRTWYNEKYMYETSSQENFLVLILTNCILFVIYVCYLNRNLLSMSTIAESRGNIYNTSFLLELTLGRFPLDLSR